MGGTAPAPKVPTAGQGTHLTLRPHRRDTEQGSQSSEEGDAHQPGGSGEASWRRGLMKTRIGHNNT